MRVVDFIFAVFFATIIGAMLGSIGVLLHLDSRTNKVVQCKYIVDVNANPRKICE